MPINNKKYKKPQYKKSQAWLIDLIVGMLIFVMAVSLFYRYASSQLEGSSSINELIADGKSLTSSLASPGYPSNWTNETVIRLGVTDDKNYIDKPKVEKLLNISHSQMKSLLNTRFDFFVFIEDKRGCMVDLNSDLGSDAYGFGHSDIILNEGGSANCDIANAKNMSIDLSSMDIEKLAKVERFVVYDFKIAKMVAYVWT